MDFYSKHSSKEIAQSSYSLGLLYYFKQDMILCTGSGILQGQLFDFGFVFALLHMVMDRYHVVGKVYCV